MTVLDMKGNFMPELAPRDRSMRLMRSKCIIRTDYGRLDGVIVGRHKPVYLETRYLVKTDKGIFHDVTEDKFTDA